jgi:hypothetical protein
MQTNIRGLVERLSLPAGRGIMPLFEAVSNAMDAIAERPVGSTPGAIRIRLLALNDLARQAGDETLKIDGFEVEDNGVGLDADHMAAFGEAYTRTKLSVGGKGVGRFTYLKVFSDVRIESTYAHGNSFLKRDFRFSIENDVSGSDTVTQSNGPTRTKVSMSGLDPNYGAAWPTDPVSIATQIVEHFLIRFASRICPAMTLESPTHAPIDLKKVFDATVLPHIEERIFHVGGHQFSLQAFRNRDGRARHAYHLCATGREVASANLKDLLPELPERFVDDQQQPYKLIVLVTGEYLDIHSNQERTAIAFRPEADLALDETLVSRQALNKGIAETLRHVLVGDLTTTHNEKIAQIERFVEQAPEYRVLTHEKYRPLLERRVEPGLKPEQLDEALLHIKREVEDNVRKELRHVAALMEKEQFDEYQERIRRLMEEMNDVGKSQLAAYIAQRRIILDLVGTSLKRVQADSKYPFEKVLHKMIFPMGVTSRDVFLGQQNLWLIDERLCFHTLLTSDKRLNQVRGLENTSAKEPDIFSFFYDTPIGISEPDNLSGGGVVVVEFKRPGRDDYDRDPTEQIIQRFIEIKEAKIKDIEGRPINPDRLRYTGYLIADLTPTLRKHVMMRFHPTVDNEGYFQTLPSGEGYVEIISYDKLLQDAKRRNRVLFDKLGLHKH